MDRSGKSLAVLGSRPDRRGDFGDGPRARWGLRAGVLMAATLVAFLAVPSHSHGAETQRQAEVAKRGADVMPFDVKATTHIFTKTRDGGIQRVVVKDAADLPQMQLIRQHLHDIRSQFERGDFSGPTHIHGQDMPGLAQLAAAQRGQIVITYQEVDGGGQLRYHTAEAALVLALHAWFDAQLADHGTDAVSSHEHQHGEPSER